MASQTWILLSTVLIVSNVRGTSIPLSTRSTQSPDRRTANDTRTQPEIRSLHFQIIRNSTVPCNNIKQLELDMYRYHPLSNEDKMAILELKGGKFIKEYMAKDEQGAKETFPSLLEFNLNFKDKKSQPKYAVTKAAIKHILDKEAEEEQKTGNGKGVQGDTGEKDTSRHSGPAGQRNGTSTWPKSKKIKGLVRPQDVGLPVHVTDLQTGETSELEACLTRGTPTRDNTHLYMCTTCAATTNLGSTYWPPIINEAKCLQADPYCFIVDDIPHGACKQKVISMQVLKKQDGYCALGLKNGETVIVDDWVIRDRIIQMGCECVINVNSEFAQYVGRYEGPQLELSHHAP